MTALNLVLANLLAIVGAGAFAIWIVRRQRNVLAPPGAGQALRADAAGVLVVPILAARIRGGGLFGGMAQNSINPKLSLTRDGLDFKVMLQGQWTWAELTRVNAAKGLLGPTIEFVSRRASLTVTVRDLSVARQVLAALPPTAPLSEKAAALRDERVSEGR